MLMVRASMLRGARVWQGGAWQQRRLVCAVCSCSGHAAPLSIRQAESGSSRGFVSWAGNDQAAALINLFDVLEVSRNATPSQMKQQFYKKAKQLHPDVLFDAGSGDTVGKKRSRLETELIEKEKKEKLKAAEEKFVELTHAYEVLSDPKQRALYMMQYDMGSRRQQRNAREYRHQQYYQNQAERGEQTYPDEEDLGKYSGEWAGQSPKKKEKTRAAQEYFDGSKYQTYPGLAKRGLGIYQQMQQEYDEALAHAYHGPVKSYKQF